MLETVSVSSATRIALIRLFVLRHKDVIATVENLAQLIQPPGDRRPAVAHRRIHAGVAHLGLHDIQWNPLGNRPGAKGVTQPVRAGRTITSLFLVVA